MAPEYFLKVPSKISQMHNSLPSSLQQRKVEIPTKLQQFLFLLHPLQMTTTTSFIQRVNTSNQVCPFHSSAHLSWHVERDGLNTKYFIFVSESQMYTQLGSKVGNDENCSCCETCYVSFIQIRNVSEQAQSIRKHPFFKF